MVFEMLEVCTCILFLVLSCWFSLMWLFVWIYVCLGDQGYVDHAPIACKENGYLYKKKNFKTKLAFAAVLNCCKMQHNTRCYISLRFITAAKCAFHGNYNCRQNRREICCILWQYENAMKYVFRGSSNCHNYCRELHHTIDVGAFNGGYNHR